MSLFPKIQSPCPYVNEFSAIMVGDQCSKCKKTVVDMTEMSGAERKALVAECKGEMCVSYKVVARSAAAAAALGAMAAAAPLAAQDAAAPHVQADAQEEINWDSPENWIIVGGLRAPERADWEEHQPAEMTDMPVIDESGAA